MVNRPLQRQFLNALLGSTTLLVYLVDRKLKYAYANKSGLAAHGYDRRPPNWDFAEAIAKQAGIETVTELVADVLKCFSSGAAHAETLMEYDEGNWAQVTLTPIMDEEDVAYVAIISRDVTEAVMRGEERRRLVGTILQAAEEERQRISHDLHDDVLQEMTAVLIQMDALRMHTDAPEVQSRLMILSGTMRHAIDRTRGLMFELHPPILEYGGIGPAVVELANRIVEEMEPQPVLTTDIDVSRTHNLVEATCFRIVRESLINVRKHSQAKNIHIKLWRVDSHICGEIVDDGKGFNYEKWESSTHTFGYRHFGLASLIERIRLAGGNCEIETKPKKGVKISFWLPDEPLPQSAQAE